MENIDSIISKWDMLLDDLRQHSFGDGDVEEDLFKSAVKDSFYYFKEVIKPQENNSDCMLTIKESQLLSHIYAYSVQIICTLSEISEYCEATQLVAEMLYNAVVYMPKTSYMLTRNALYMTLINNKSGETLIGCYDIEKEDLGEVIELVRFKYAD